MTTRRRRSDTIQAENYDEFLRLCLMPKAPAMPHTKSSFKEPHLLSQSWPSFSKKHSHHMEKLQQEQQQNSSNFWDDIDFVSSEDVIVSSTIEEEELVIEPEKTFTNIMVIGAAGTGRHRLVNSLFTMDCDQGQKMRMPLDLVIHSAEEGSQIDVFKFWIKDACYGNYKNLLQVYYRSVSLIVFLYQINDRDSFECLDQAISEVKSSFNSGEQFVGILVGGKSSDFSQEQRKVEPREAQELQRKYGLKAFLETDFVYDQEHQIRFEDLIPSKKGREARL